MNEEKFKIGDLVWAKMKNYPPWPAKIIKSNSSSDGPKHEKSYFVYFFGSKNFAWIPAKDIRLHSEKSFNSLSKKKLKSYDEAVNELRCEVLKQSNPAAISSVSVESETSERKISDPKSSKLKQKEVINAPQIIKVPSDDKNHHKKVLAAKGSCKKVNCKSLSIENPDAPSTSYVTKKCSGSSVSSLNSRHGPYVGEACSERSIQSGPICSFDFSRDFIPKKKFGLLSSDSNWIEMILHKLYDSGFEAALYVLEIDQSKDHDYYKDLGATLHENPAMVVCTSDIIFCYYKEEAKLRDTMFDQLQNVLFGFDLALTKQWTGKVDPRNPKGLVVLTVISDETADKIKTSIGAHNALYLEAPLGDTEEMAEGKLSVQASGSKRIFEDSAGFFKTIAKYYDFVSCEVGYASRLGIIVNMVTAGINSAIEESAKMARKLNLDRRLMEEMLKIFIENGSLREIMINIGNSHFKGVNTPLKKAQKDLDLALGLSNSLSVPMPIAAATNELLKRGNQLNYSNSDISCMYEILKH